MIVLLSGTDLDDTLARAVDVLERAGLTPSVAVRGGENYVVSGGDAPADVEAELLALPGVAEVRHPSGPHRLAGREFRSGDSVVRIGNGLEIGSGAPFVVTAGPCAVESEELLTESADAVIASGAAMLRGGAYKPRTSPFSFAGYGGAALKLLAGQRERTGLPIVTEVLDIDHLALVAAHTDMLQIGTRNMQNFTLLKEAGRMGLPVLLKRGMSATVEEWLLAAEYVLAGGADVVLCERGIRTFEPATRFTLDISAVPVVKQLSHLPVIVDPSHASGRRELVKPLALAAAAAGADGLIVDVHTQPRHARCDGSQALTADAFADLMTALTPVVHAVGRELARPPVVSQPVALSA